MNVTDLECSCQILLKESERVFVVRPTCYNSCFQYFGSAIVCPMWPTLYVVNGLGISQVTVTYSENLIMR